MPSVISTFTIIVYRKTNVDFIFICIFFFWVEPLVFFIVATLPLDITIIIIFAHNDIVSSSFLLEYERP